MKKWKERIKKFFDLALFTLVGMVRIPWILVGFLAVVLIGGVVGALWGDSWAWSGFGYGAAAVGVVGFLLSMGIAKWIAKEIGG